MVFKIFVHGFRGELMRIDVCDTEDQFRKITVLQLKEIIQRFNPDNVPGVDFRLIFVDKVLDEDTKLLSEYGIQHMSVIRAVAHVTGGGNISKSMERLAGL